MAGAREGLAGRAAFTLIELLVVISIIGVLAGLVLGLTGLATRKSKEGRVRIEMTKLIGDIENYKANLGFYPPDNQTGPVVNGERKTVAGPNQLFYELSGTVYVNNQFTVAGRQEPISPAAIQNLFGSSGFANAARDAKDLKFTTEFKASQYKRVVYKNQAIDVLVSPVKGPDYWALKVGSVTVNPWLYVSTGATNNPEAYDLWTEVIINGKLMRFSNWERDPVVLSP